MAGGQSVTVSTGSLGPGDARELDAGNDFITPEQGSFGKALTIALVGIALTIGQGSIVPRTPGQGATVSQGTATPSTTIALTGSSISVGQGAATPNSDGVVPLVGSSVSASQGSFGLSWGQALTGAETTSSAGSAGVLVRPTDIAGQALTVSDGTLVAGGSAVTAHLSGSEATFVQGDVTGGTQFITGVEVLTAAGTATYSLTVGVTGSEVVASGGLVSPEQNAVDTLILSISGTPLASVDIPITGSAITSEQGAVSVTGDSVLALTGEASTVSAGSMPADSLFDISGQEIVSTQSSMGAPGTASLSGSEVSVVAGSVFTTNDREFALSGISVAVQDGSTFASPLAFVEGQEMVVSAQEIGPREVALSGQFMLALAGEVILPRLPKLTAAGVDKNQRKRNYIYKGKRYHNITNEELLRLIAQDMLDITREDIKVSYKNQKPHTVSKEAWSELTSKMAEIQLAPKDSDDDDIEAIIALL